MIADMKRIGDESKTGKMSRSIQLILFKKAVTPAIIFNLETWINWRKKDWEKLEKSQMNAIKSMFNLPKTIPGWGLMKECGFWKMRERELFIKTSYN